MRLHDLKPRPGAKHRVKRLGCGESSGHGKTSGKGHKGQKARSGGSIRPGFEGGQMPLIRRLPKRGFNNAVFKASFALVNIEDLEEFDSGTRVTEQLLREKGLVVEAEKFSGAARQKIEQAGGSVVVLGESLKSKIT